MILRPRLLLFGIISSNQSDEVVGKRGRCDMACALASTERAADTGNSRVRLDKFFATRRSPHFIPTLHIMASAFFFGFRPEAVGRSGFVAMGVSAADLPVAACPSNG